MRKLFFFIWGTLRRVLDLMSIARYDIVFIHRQAFPIRGLLFERILSLIRKPFILDFDDAIFLPATSRPNLFIEKFKNSNEVAAAVRMSKHVIAGNGYLADFAARFNKNVTIIPTPIDTDKYNNSEKSAPGKKIVIGWIGSATTADFLLLLKTTFQELSKNFPELIFKFLGGNYYDAKIGNAINIPWSMDNEIKELKTFDIGIMPMPDNGWTRGKCGFKLIIYMSMGIPCVCSPVGVNKEIIRDGVNGYCAGSQNEWIEKLSMLVKDPVIRRKIGSAGRKTVEERYSVRVNAPRLLGVIINSVSGR